MVSTSIRVVDVSVPKGVTVAVDKAHINVANCIWSTNFMANGEIFVLFRRDYIASVLNRRDVLNVTSNIGIRGIPYPNGVLGITNRGLRVLIPPIIGIDNVYVLVGNAVSMSIVLRVRRKGEIRVLWILTTFHVSRRLRTWVPLRIGHVVYVSILVRDAEGRKNVLAVFGRTIGRNEVDWIVPFEPVGTPVLRKIQDIVEKT